MGNDGGVSEQVSAALGKGELRFRTLVGAVSAITWSCPSSGLHIEPQPEWMAFTGQSAEELLGDGWKRVVHPEDREAALLKWLEAVALGEPYECEARILRHDGEWRWMSARAVPIRDANGEIVEWFGMNIDITEQKKAAEALRESEERFRLFADNSPTISWMKDEDGRFVYASRKYERRFGVEAADWQGKTDAELWPPEIAEEFRRNDQMVLNAGHPIEIVEETLQPDGSRCSWLVTKFPFCDAAGKRYVGGIGLDITERRRAEISLRESEERLRLALEASRAGSWTWDAVSNVSSWDDGFLALYECPQGAALPFESWIERLHPEDRDRILSRIERLRATPGDDKWNEEFRSVSPEGRLRWHQALGEAKHDASGALVKMVGIDLDITERKQAEEALRRSEELNRRTLQALPAHIAVLDRNGLILATNQAWAEFAAANSAAGDPSVTVGANYLQACRGAAAAEDESAKLALEGLESVIEGRRSSFSLEYPCLSPEGERWFIMNVAPLGADDGAVVTHLNITERRQAENALRESEERLRRVSDNADVGLIRCNRESIYLSANPAYAKIVGKPLEQIIGRPMSEVMGEQAAQSIRPYIERALRGERFSFEGEVPYVGAGKRYVQVSNAPDAGPAGEIASWVACLMDVTERKRAEIALRASERRFRVLFKSQLAFSTLLSPEGRLVDMSDACVGVAGATLEELVGLSFVEAPWWQDLPETRESWRRQIEEARTRPGPVLGEIEHRMNDGELRYALNSVTALRDEQGELEYFLCEGLDITERKRAEAALREADRRKDEFLATLAHELRNPLAPVRNGLEALRSLGVQDKSTDRPLAMMEGQVDHLIRLVDDLMDISRISRGKFELQKQRMDLAAAVSQAVNMSRHLIEAEGLDLKVDLPRSPTPVDGDAVRLTQVFANLLSNAAKHTKRGGRIEIALERVGDAAEARVVDTGAGIAEELLPLIFEPFVQGGGKSGGPEQGLGIGLALVRQIAEMHGGAIEARSGGEGFGSAFIVRLPLLGDEATETPVETSVPARLDSARRVLVIDDMPEVAEALAFLLDVLGATVRVAHCGEQSLELCAEFEPDLVLLDLSMPKMDGFETARRLKQLPAGRRAKLVAVTGFGERRSRARTQEAGFESHLVKPVRLQQLEELLASVGAGAARQTTAE